MLGTSEWQQNGVCTFDSECVFVFVRNVSSPETVRFTQVLYLFLQFWQH